MNYFDHLHPIPFGWDGNAPVRPDRGGVAGDVGLPCPGGQRIPQPHPAELMPATLASEHVHRPTPPAEHPSAHYYSGRAFSSPEDGHLLK